MSVRLIDTYGCASFIWEVGFDILTALTVVLWFYFGDTSTFRRNISRLSEPLVADGGTRWRSWLTHYATSRKVAGPIPDEVIGFFNWPNPSSRTMALGSTQPLTEMSTRNLLRGKGRPVRGADNLTTICEPIV
jgi:hypothetical protein